MNIRNHFLSLRHILGSTFVVVALAGCPGPVAGNDAGDTGTTADTGNPGDTGTNDTGGSDSSSSLTCQTYCTTLMANCTGANLQYSNIDSCLGTCAKFPVGLPADTMGNTLGCRTYHANAAAGGTLHCVHAGPSGASVCGSPCESFCAVALATCTGTNMVYADNASCMTACAAFAANPPYTAAVTSGDSLSCRIYHLSVAASGANQAMMHCPHIASVSATCN